MCSSDLSQPISGYNFKAWEKFDVDKALASMDEEEDRRLQSEKAAIVQKTASTEAEAKAAQRRSKAHQQELAKAMAKLKAHEMSDVQRATIAGKYHTFTMLLYIYTYIYFIWLFTNFICGRT